MHSGDVPIYADTVDLESEYFKLVPRHVTVFGYAYTASAFPLYAPVILPWPRPLSWRDANLNLASADILPFFDIF